MLHRSHLLRNSFLQFLLWTLRAPEEIFTTFSATEYSLLLPCCISTPMRSSYPLPKSHKRWPPSGISQPFCKTPHWLSRHRTYRTLPANCCPNNCISFTDKEHQHSVRPYCLCLKFTLLCMKDQQEREKMPNLLEGISMFNKVCGGICASHMRTTP